LSQFAPHLLEELHAHCPKSTLQAELQSAPLKQLSFMGGSAHPSGAESGTPSPLGGGNESSPIALQVSGQPWQFFTSFLPVSGNGAHSPAGAGTARDTLQYEGHELHALGQNEL